MEWFIGIDGGGTKTEFLLTDEAGAVQARVLRKGCSTQSLGVEAAAAVLTDGVKALLKTTGRCISDCAGCCAGLPCWGEDIAADAAMEVALKKAFAPLPVLLVNDADIACAGSFGNRQGIHIVAGTGSIVYGKDGKGESARCGGWSEFFGDEGSCYWVGRETMRLFSHEADGRTERGSLYDLVRQTFALKEDFEFMKVVLQEIAPYRERVAEFQKIALAAAQAGDIAVQQLYVRAAEELARMAESVRRTLDLPDGVPVSYSGGLFHAGELILRPLREQVKLWGGKLCTPEHSPAEGAAILARQLYEEMKTCI